MVCVFGFPVVVPFVLVLVLMFLMPVSFTTMVPVHRLLVPVVLVAAFFIPMLFVLMFLMAMFFSMATFFMSMFPVYLSSMPMFSMLVLSRRGTHIPVIQYVMAV